MYKCWQTCFSLTGKEQHCGKTRVSQSSEHSVHAGLERPTIRQDSVTVAVPPLSQPWLSPALADPAPSSLALCCLEPGRDEIPDSPTTCPDA